MVSWFQSASTTVLNLRGVKILVRHSPVNAARANKPPIAQGVPRCRPLGGQVRPLRGHARTRRRPRAPVAGSLAARGPHGTCQCPRVDSEPPDWPTLVWNSDGGPGFLSPPRLAGSASCPLTWSSSCDLSWDIPRRRSPAIRLLQRPRLSRGAEGGAHARYVRGRALVSGPDHHVADLHVRRPSRCIDHLPVQSRCKCRRGTPSPDANVAGASPFPMQL